MIKKTNNTTTTNKNNNNNYNNKKKKKRQPERKKKRFKTRLIRGIMRTRQMFYFKTNKWNKEYETRHMRFILRENDRKKNHDKFTYVNRYKFKYIYIYFLWVSKIKRKITLIFMVQREHAWAQDFNRQKKKKLPQYRI